MRRTHGVPGQLNIYVLDVESEVTGRGVHNRLIVMRGTGDELGYVYIREDIRGLPPSTEDQRQALARHPGHRLHPARTRLVHVESVAFETRGGPAIEHRYRIT